MTSVNWQPCAPDMLERRMVPSSSTGIRLVFGEVAPLLAEVLQRRAIFPRVAMFHGIMLSWGVDCPQVGRFRPGRK